MTIKDPPKEINEDPQLRSNYFRNLDYFGSYERYLSYQLKFQNSQENKNDCSGLLFMLLISFLSFQQ